MPMYKVTWTSIREGATPEEAIENSKPRESRREDGSFLDPGLPRADELVKDAQGEYMLKAHQEYQKLAAEHLRLVGEPEDDEDKCPNLCNRGMGGRCAACV